MPQLRLFTLGQGNLIPELEFTVEDEDGNAIDLTACSSVQFLMATIPSDWTDSANKVNAVATFVDKPAGRVKYSWAGTDTDTPGRFAAIFEFVDGVGKKFSVPNDDYIYIVITPRPPAP